MKCKKTDTKTVFLSLNSKFPAKILGAGLIQLLISRVYDMKSAVVPLVRDPLRGFWRVTYYFTIKTQFSYRISYISWTLDYAFLEGVFKIL